MLGRYGTESQKDVSLKAEKVGDLVAEGEFYTQLYKVTANVEMSQYTITATTGMPTGAYITDTNGNKKTTFNSSENFKVYIPKASMNSDINMSIAIDGKLKTYPVFYGETPNIEWQEYAVTYDPFTNEQGIAKLNVKTDVSSIKIIKTDEESGEALEGIVFNAKYENGDNIGEFITDENGTITINNLRQGKVILTETSTGEEYILDSTPIEVELQYNEAEVIEVTNERIKGQIEIYKTSSDDNFIEGTKAGSPIKDIPFHVYDENKQYVTTVITDENGHAITEELDKGIYYVYEGENDSWYLLNTTEFTAEIVNNGDVITLEITNDSEKPNIDIEKEGIIQTTANQEIKYDFKIRNTGNVPLDNFTWYDYLPTDYVRITKLITGTYNQDLNYSIYYKTNKNDYKLLKDNLNTQVNNYIDFSNLELEVDEYVTEFKADFGTVDVGFESVIDPYIFVKVNSTVQNDDVFTNNTRIEGYNKTYMVWDEDEHTTKVYEKEIEVKMLPRTGY